MTGPHDQHEETSSDPSIFTLDWTKAAQARASDPEASAWVSANAGSGKTHVLSQRVIRLLLRGARPSSVLCLTYTKAAASEMSNRVFARLAAWTRLADDALAEAIFGIEGEMPTPARLAFARQLFALALETPGGLKIQTIHAFCEAVLHQFPLEANVAGHFAVMDDGATATLLAEAKRLLLTATSSEDEAALAAAFATVLEAAGEQGLESLLDDLINKRGDIARFVADAARHGGVEPVLRKALGVAPGDDGATIKAAVWPLRSMPPETIDAFAAAASSQKNATPKKYAEALTKAAKAGTADARWAVLAEIFLTSAGVQSSTRNAGTGAVADMMPDAQQRIEDAQQHFLACLDRLKTMRMLDASLAAHALAGRLNEDYERLKRQRGRLDFDDLVQRTAGLLQRQGASAWVHYKLDQGIDHILVDEAQDTSPAQWSIIRGLSDEFFAGETSARAGRTLFSVGDEKQSIYSFQGARPERFMEEGAAVSRMAQGIDGRFEEVELKLSFRSTADVLKAVDHVFESADTHRGLGRDSTAVIHSSVRDREPGLVDVWDMLGKEKRLDDDDWTAPFDDTPESDPKAQVARRVAGTIRQWIAGERRVHKGKSLPIRAGDILVLVRKRDAFVNALMRELKQAPAIAVAGADRLTLTDHIAVKDLMALGRVMALPDDDLSLAALLKSPLFDLSEDDLFRLCARRPDQASVYGHLDLLAHQGEAPFVEAQARLTAWRALAAMRSVHDFYAELLGPGGVRARILARLGHEAADILDEFLAFALDHESSSLPGMQSFLAVLDAQSPVIKRELEQDRDEVRIMTVHASKGLEAPIVFLVDSGGEAARAQHIPKLRALDVSRTVGPMSPAILWVPGKEHENDISGQLKTALSASAEEEYRRLLYVGMTRAADRLVVCGYHGVNAPKHRHWQKMVQEALAARDAEPRSFSVGDVTWEGLRFQRARGEQVFPEAAEKENSVREDADMAIPLTALPPPSRPPRPLMPSGAGSVIDDDVAQTPTGSPLFDKGTASTGLERGRIIHRFMQVLPGLPENGRDAAARRYLARAVPDWPAEDCERIIASVMAILADPGFGHVFSPGSEAEVSIMGTVRLDGRDHVVSGRIDRLAVLEDRVLIVDYKTNRPPCRTLDDVPFAYRAQMALYRELIAPLYPGRSIEAALIFTEAPALVTLSADVLDAALAGITTK